MMIHNYHIMIIVLNVYYYSKYIHCINNDIVIYELWCGYGTEESVLWDMIYQFIINITK